MLFFCASATGYDERSWKICPSLWILHSWKFNGRFNRKKKRRRNVNIVKCFKGQVIIIIIIFNHSCKVVQWKLLLFIYLSIQFNIIYYNIGIWKYNKLCYVASIVVKIEKILKIHRVLIFNILYLRQQIFNISLNISLIFPLNLV